MLRHAKRYSDAELGRAAGLSAGDVKAVLAEARVERTHAQQERIARRATLRAPSCWTPQVLLQRVFKLRSRPLTRADLAACGTVFLASLALYAITSARTVTGEDAGELIAAAHTLGVPHPPGYPLWTLLAAAFDHLLPLGTVAWRVTLASAVPAALANALLLALAFKTLSRRLSAWLTTGLFAVSLTHWSQSVIPEVYGLNTLAIVALALLLVRLVERPTRGRLVALYAVAGLACTNHTSAVPIALLAVGAAALRVALIPSTLPHSGRAALTAGLAFVAPLALFAYLPLAASTDPYLNWGDPSSWDGFVAHVTRAQYAAAEAGQEATASSYGDYLSRLGILGDAALRQFGGPWVVALCVLGLFWLALRQAGTWLFLMATAWLCSIGITQYSSYSFDREHVYANQIFFIPAWLTLAWLAGGGLDVLLSEARKHLGPRSQGRTRPWAAAACVALVAVPGVRHHTLVDRSETTLIADYGKALLDGMEPGALYLPSSDHSTFAVLYWQGVEGHRTDVVVADKYGLLEPAVLDRALTAEDRQTLAAVPTKERRKRTEQLLIERWPGPVYLAGRDPLPAHLGRLEPDGLLMRVMSPDEASAWWVASPRGDEAVGVSAPPGLAAWRRLEHLDLDDSEQAVDFTVQMVRGDILAMRGLAQLKAGQPSAALGMWARIGGDLAPFKEIHNNIGADLAEAGRLADAETFLRKALAEDPSYLLALRNLTNVQRAAGEPRAAIETLRALLDHHPQSQVDQLTLARLLRDEGSLEAALVQYEQLAVRDPQDPLPWREAGQLLEQGGDFTKAAQAYRESLARAPGQEDIAAALSKIEQGIPQLLASMADPLDGLPDPLGLTTDSGHFGVEDVGGVPEFDGGGPVMPPAIQGASVSVPLPPDPVADLLAGGQQ